ncbi:methyltransferase domain-containing protein [Halobacteriovorax sp. HLS]|uniref:methyltransferase domain-containing protein n=1 Tax=Halobacteriovorax sp. HLS TaxID=2234000 RepID=UPI000FD7A749|nr:methyltransferase domain-containing protein [Halobacteriovorax sp. HLS]
MNICPLCHESKNIHYFKDRRTFLRCLSCNLVFVEREDLLPINEEKKIYDLHENDPDDIRYHEFLNRLLIPMNKYIKGIGLDFGCGPGPVVSQILKDRKTEVFEYDPIFNNNLDILNFEYDYIICSEVIEHIYETEKSIELLLKLLKPLGALGVMTSFYPDDMSKFKGWGYKNDPTHVRFFSEDTFRWIAIKYNLEIEIPRKNVVILKRKL